MSHNNCTFWMSRVIWSCGTSVSECSRTVTPVHPPAGQIDLRRFQPAWFISRRGSAMSLRETSIESRGDERLTPLSTSSTPREFTPVPIRSAAKLPEVRLLSLDSITVPSLAARPAYDVAKRIVDIAGSVLLIIFTAPIWLTAAALIKLTSSGSVLFIQTRLGKEGAPFWCIKFRTMDPDADEQKAHLLHLNEVDGPMFKMRDDPRITRMGRWLRRLSIDELPQLICVLRGEMSLVGPR